MNIAHSPLTNKIYIVRANDKTEVTGAACFAVAEHVLATKQPIIVVGGGIPLYEISVKKIEPKNN
jgi:hypothetical protein